MPALPDGPWSVATGEHGGRPLIVRVNTGAAVVARHPALTHRVGIAIPLHAPDASGLPNSDEAATLAHIETALEAALRVGQNSVLVLVLTTGGMREFVLYSAAPQKVSAAIASLQARFGSHEIQSYVEIDLEWARYAEFAEAL